MKISGNESGVTLEAILLFSFEDICKVLSFSNLGYNVPLISCLPSRFKSLLQNRPAAENTCIEISHVKYNIFHVRLLFYHLLLFW